jgi:voltage-gated potassium channel
LVRVAASLIYAVDVTIRARLAHRHVNYLVTHPVAIASVVFPPVRVLFSLRLIRRVFRRGNLALFLFAATVLVLNGSIVVYFYERHAPHSNIHSLGDAVWWAFVTVTTVGYGDFYPVTPQGRITACVIMGIGIMTLAVVTAQVASSFVSQGSRSALDPAVIAPASTQGLASPDPSLQSKLTDLDRRLARIEDLIVGMSGRPHST